MKEYEIMQTIRDENIVSLFGVVLESSTIMIITELAPLRSLLECLKEPGLKSTLTVPTLALFSRQICSGMKYLESRRLIHRDLAARNILVFSRSLVKISDFGLSRALGVGKDYYQTNFNMNLKLPIAWCAPECITFLKFTSGKFVYFLYWVKFCQFLVINCGTIFCLYLDIVKVNFPILGTISQSYNIYLCFESSAAHFAQNKQIAPRCK